MKYDKKTIKACVRVALKEARAFKKLGDKSSFVAEQERMGVSAEAICLWVIPAMKNLIK